MEAWWGTPFLVQVVTCGWCQAGPCQLHGFGWAPCHGMFSPEQNTDSKYIFF